jgi:hypothetical protein
MGDLIQFPKIVQDRIATASPEDSDPVTRLARLSDLVWSLLPASARRAAEEAQR